MVFEEVNPDDVPVELLLEADPSEANIQSYLSGGWCFAAREQDRIVGACIVKTISDRCVEIFNVSVMPELQGRGIGTQLLNYVLDGLAQRSIKRVELGTGTFGYQLTFYQRLGFRVSDVITNHFLDHYPEPIFEHGIQHKDMLRLYLDLVD
ncbi:GNAT family N-acetyltransferase [Endozoicomonas elysicola]|uniref:GCN5 family acetyltransferase n=1 Tax=Endozoicomonas elysicola TaxID=305900 RepID=A0A081KDC5_9GAMM|nr:GNAT family N-acetyltransferase [Endozoicomonas elysicola]KEI72151.1 GCN5 family acetyltransferase [Endozoicomonas elysicola]